MSQDDVILLVEDDHDFALLVKDTLAAADILSAVYVVGSGEEAIAYLEGRGRFSDRYIYPFPSLILLDLRMPGISGFGVLRRLRMRYQLKRELDVIVISGNLSSKEFEVAYELGALACLTKSPGSKGLADLVQYLREANLIGSDA